MLIIAGTFEVDPARRDEFIVQKEGGMRESRAEAGCLDYVLSADPLEPGRVYLFERWESKEHLAPHLARLSTPSSAPDPKAVPVLAVDLQQYEIASVGLIGS
jgi:quinol monooxygenase YgiN